MNDPFLPVFLLRVCLLVYVAGAGAGLLLLRFKKAANFFSFGCAASASLCGILSCVIALASGTPATNQSFDLFTSLIPYVQFTVRLDALSAFFGLIVSLLGDRKSVGRERV